MNVEAFKREGEKRVKIEQSRRVGEVTGLKLL